MKHEKGIQTLCCLGRGMGKSEREREREGNERKRESGKKRETHSILFLLGERET